MGTSHMPHLPKHSLSDPALRCGENDMLHAYLEEALYAYRQETRIYAGNVPNAARVSRQWNACLQSIEDTLWLGLVRKHSPFLEELMLNMTVPVGDGGGEDDAGDAGTGTGTGGIPAPLRNWRLQLQRELMLDLQARRKREEEALQPCPEPNQSPEPLSAYCLRVDLVFRAGDDTKVGTTSTLVDELHFDGHYASALADSEPFRRLRFTIPPLDMKEVRSDHPSVTHFDLALTLYQRTSGKQVALYCGTLYEYIPGQDACWSLESKAIVSEIPLGHLSNMPDTSVVVGCEPQLYKAGCACFCTDEEEGEGEGDNDLIRILPPPSCRCCTCVGGAWPCFCGIDVELDINYCFDSAYVELDNLQMLQFLERLDFV